MKGREAFALVRPALVAILAVLGMVPYSWCTGMLVFCRNMPGRIGIGLRWCLVRRLAASCGDNVAVYAGVHLHDLAEAHFGSNIKIGEMCFVGASGGLTVESDVSIAHGCTVLTEEHDYRARGPLRETPLLFAPVRIERGVWIGAGSRILSGVTIGGGSAVGAGSVVTRDVPPGTVAAGVPARVLRRRHEPNRRGT